MGYQTTSRGRGRDTLTTTRVALHRVVEPGRGTGWRRYLSAEAAAELPESPAPAHVEILGTICPVCYKKLNRPCDVVRHLKTVSSAAHHSFRQANPEFQADTMPCPFASEGCPKVFPRIDSVRRHRRVHEKRDDKEQQSRKASKDEKEKKGGKEKKNGRTRR